MYVLCVYYICIMYVLCIPGEKEQILERNMLFYITFLDFMEKTSSFSKTQVGSYFEKYKTLTPLHFCSKLFILDPFGPQGSPVTSQKMPGFVNFPILSTPLKSPPQKFSKFPIFNFLIHFLQRLLTLSIFWPWGALWRHIRFQVLNIFSFCVHYRIPHPKICLNANFQLPSPFS